MTLIGKIQDDHGIVGRDEELAMSLTVLDAGRHLLLEGPVGVGKTTVALAVCRYLGRDTIRVDGDDRYTESKLTGWFDPPLVLQKGYSEETFFAGPLVEAMRGGAVGMSTGLVTPPGSWSKTEEIIELARVVGQAGGTVTQAGKQFDPELVAIFFEIYDVIRAIREKWA